MATSTTNLNLTLPSGNENVSRQALNDNFSKIDNAVGSLDETKYEKPETGIPAEDLASGVIPTASGSTSIQNYEGGVYDVGILNNSLKVSVPYKRFEIKSGSGLDDFTIRKQIDGKTVNVHFLSNDGVVSVNAGSIGTADEGLILVGTVQGYQLPPNDPQYQSIVNAYRLFSVASTSETQAIITEYAEVSA